MNGESESKRKPRPLRDACSLMASAAFGGALAGWVLTWMTVGINRHLLDHWLDPLILALWFSVPVATILLLGTGVIVGATLAMGSTARGEALLRRVSSRGLVRVVQALLAAAPAASVMALPDIGLSGKVVSNALLGGRTIDMALMAFLLALLIGLGTFLAWFAISMIGRAGSRKLARIPVALVILVILALVPLTLVSGNEAKPPEAATMDSLSFSEDEEAHDAPAFSGFAGDDTGSFSGTGTSAATTSAATRVVLLNIDGLDPGVIDTLGPEVLPFLHGIRETGVYGALQTEVPTLSPPIWTTIVTGLPRQQHGIRGFLYFQVPGLSRPIWQFPLHSGLNFKLMPLLDKTFSPHLARPLAAQFQSVHRKEPALWEILEGIGPIGVFRWRVTWPAEELDGFVVAEGVSQILDEKPWRHVRLGQRYLWPENAFAGLLPRKRSEAGLDLVQRLAGLTEKFDARLVVAGFSSVDGVQHRYGLGWNSDDSKNGEDPIVRRYQRQDAMLTRLAERLGPETDLIIVSDHGFAFDHGHHAQAPPGVFAALGPSFKVGSRVEGMSIYDVTPLVIDLFGVPLSLELPGTARGAYRQALRVVRSRETVAAYRERDIEGTAVDDADLEATKERLRGLGYIN